MEMSLMSPIFCAGCNGLCMRRNSDINRAKKLGRPLYCSKECAGRQRRTELSAEAKKERKRLYDIEYRKLNHEQRKAQKAAYFKATYDPIAAAIERKKRAPQHAEYCRQPEYKAYKQQYDREYRAKKEYGEFWQCLLLLLSIEAEVSDRATDVEIRAANGTLNKRQTRKREYERLNRN